MHDREALVAGIDLAVLADELMGLGRSGPFGATWPCPDAGHGSRSGGPPEFVVYATSRGEQRWQCTSCGAGGTAVELLMSSGDMGVGAALEALARRAVAAGMGEVSATFQGGGRGGRSGAAGRVEAWVDILGAAAGLIDGDQ